MTNKCGKCKNKLTNSEKRVLCVGCKFYYHADCVQLTENELQFLEEADAQWTCNVCRSNNRVLRSISQSTGNAVSTNLNSGGSSVSDDGASSERQEILALLGTISRDISSIKTTQEAIVREIALCNSKLDKHASLIADNSKNIETCRDRLDALSGEQGKLSVNVSELSDKMVTLELQTQKLNRDAHDGGIPPVNLEMTTAEVFERLTRSKNLIVSGVPAVVDMEAEIRGVLSCLDVGISTSNISSVIRLQSGRPNGVGLVKVTLDSQERVVSALRAKKK